jgi:hypothetical protein
MAGKRRIWSGQKKRKEKKRNLLGIIVIIT